MVNLPVEILDKEKKKKIVKELEIYGMENIPHLILKWGKRYRIFSGSIDNDSLRVLLRDINIDSIGLYFASFEDDLRLSIDSAQLFANQLKNGTLSLGEEQSMQWFHGKDLELNDTQKKEINEFSGKYIILKNNEDIIGVGKKNVRGIANFMPKERRIKN
ncbi:MAG: hypothetical protein V1660_04120 [archaeon]